MNPTDQARKEARKRELKKNKKQRQMVRTAVLKGKNPRDIIFELEKVDDMEYNIVSPSPLNGKVLLLHLLHIRVVFPLHFFWAGSDGKTSEAGGNLEPSDADVRNRGQRAVLGVQKAVEQLLVKEE